MSLAAGPSCHDDIEAAGQSNPPRIDGTELAEIRRLIGIAVGLG